MSGDSLGLDPGKPNILLSFAYWDDRTILSLPIFKDNRTNLFIDSGAFTNFTSGTEKVTIGDYCAFLRSHKDMVWKYITLDVIGDSERSEENYQYMLAQGLKPVPVFTRAASTSQQRKKDLIAMSQTTDLLGLGGVAGGMHRRDNIRYMVGCANFLRKMHKPFHLLGCGSVPVIKKVLPFSCDSSSYSSAARYGSIQLFFNGKFYNANRKTLKDKSKIPDYILRKYRMPKTVRRSEFFWEYTMIHNRIEISILSYIYFQRWLYKKFAVSYFIAVLPIARDLNALNKVCNYLYTEEN